MTLTETLAWLVDIPSETGQEGRIATAIAERLLPAYGHQGVERIGNSLIVGHRGGAPLLSLFGHTDTVPSQGQGPALVADGRLHGLGASDMKAGLAVMLHLLEEEEVLSGGFDVVGVFYAAEEGPQEGNELETVFEQAGWLDDSELLKERESRELKRVIATPSLSKLSPNTIIKTVSSSVSFKLVRTLKIATGSIEEIRAPKINESKRGIVVADLI